MGARDRHRHFDCRIGVAAREDAQPGDRWAPNPVPPSPQSLEAGKRIYRAQCQVCHSVDGHGNGPAAAAQFPRPTDFVAHFASGHIHSGGRFFFWVSEGIGGTAMPAFKDRLSETERWDVVNFLKAFTPTER